MKRTYLITGLVIILLIVGGVLVWKQKPPVDTPPIVPPTVTPPAPTQPPNVDTSTWKTYRNEEYGFEVKYPGHLEVGNGETQYDKMERRYVVFFLPNRAERPFAIEIFDASENETAEQAYERITTLDLNTFTKTEITVVGMKVNYYKNLPSEGGGSDTHEVLLIHNHQLYGITNFSGNDDIFGHFISTFKFLE